jgi:hypothetical protein
MEKYEVEAIMKFLPVFIVVLMIFSTIGAASASMKIITVIGTVNPAQNSSGTNGQVNPQDNQALITLLSALAQLPDVNVTNSRDSGVTAQLKSEGGSTLIYLGGPVAELTLQM